MDSFKNNEKTDILELYTVIHHNSLTLYLEKFVYSLNQQYPKKYSNRHKQSSKTL